MGTRTLQLLRTYWCRLQMVDKDGGNFGFSFKVCRGVTQGDPLSPKIFYLVVEAGIRHCVVVVAPTEARAEGPGENIQ